MSLVSNKSKKIFLYKNRKFNINSKVDIILSPEFYWVRVFDIPVKNITQARHVLPTLFEDIISEHNELSFHVIKLEDNKYLCYAYSNKSIFKGIKNSGIPASLVNSVYFAQNECKEFRSFKVDDLGFFYTEDNILVKLPKGITSPKVNLDREIEKINLTSNKIDIKFYNNVLNSKYIYTIVGILLIISLLNSIKLLSYNGEISKVEKQINNIKQSSSLPATSIQTKAILKKYKNKIVLESKKREVLEYILQKKSFNLNKVELDKNILFLSFDNIKNREIESYINKKYKILSKNIDTYFNVRIKL